MNSSISVCSFQAGEPNRAPFATVRPAARTETRLRPITDFVGRVIPGDCAEIMDAMPDASVDFVLTDPPYGARYRDRSGRTVANDDST